LPNTVPGEGNSDKNKKKLISTLAKKTTNKTKNKHQNKTQTPRYFWHKREGSTSYRVLTADLTLNCIEL